MGKNWKIKAANETSEGKEFEKETIRMIRWERVRKIEDGADESVRRHVRHRDEKSWTQRKTERERCYSPEEESIEMITRDFIRLILNLISQRRKIED